MRPRIAFAVLLAALAPPVPASAIPVFAHRYGASCQQCHTTVPELNAFGAAFAAAGYRWPGTMRERGTIPVAVKINLAYSSEPADPLLPKAIVDEVEMLSFGPVGSHAYYHLEQYAVDGGFHGSLRDAYAGYSSDPMNAWRDGRVGIFDVRAGQFTLPLPDDPETLRPTENHYAIYDQTVGENPFTLFDDRDGIDAGYSFSRVQVRALFLKDADRMVTARAGRTALALQAYDYRGRRDLTGGTDFFDRRGAALISALGKAQTSLLWQRGSDNAVSSGGGYAQEEWAFNDRFSSVVRYDRSYSSGAGAGSTTFSLSYRPYDRSRVTIEDVVTRAPKTSHALAIGWLFAY